MLEKEEYVEQAYFFQTIVERLGENMPMQELFQLLREEVLATTKLPLAIDFMHSEIKHSGKFAPAMARLGHYFSPFQTYIIQEAEEDTGRFDMRVALSIVHHLAEFLSKTPPLPAVFLYQFETLCRNRLRYDKGLEAMSGDPVYPSEWCSWILEIRRQLGIIGLGEMIYVRSEQYVHDHAGKASELRADQTILFGLKEGKIALANRKKDPLLLFAALQRHLGYPRVPRLERHEEPNESIPLMVRRLERLEQRIKLLEEEQMGGIDITKFYSGGQPPGAL